MVATHSYAKTSMHFPCLVTSSTQLGRSTVNSCTSSESSSSEAQIVNKLSKPPLSDDPSNHSVPILETLLDDTDPSKSYLVMPYLRLTNNPPFDIVNDIVDLTDQLFEGLAFIHAQNVAHSDDGCTYMYLKGFHPVTTDLKPDMRGDAPYHSRFTNPRPVKYKYVDFGISLQFASEQDHTPKLVVGTTGLDDQVPELSDVTPSRYDPFKVDVFILRNYFKQTMLNYYDNVAFLAPLVKSMTSREPADRPDAAAIVREWQMIREGI
ncbi:hypothetical protein BDY19DRAFT_180218 [Irpex rosettiformis]|uniref:Uncharacterized protein n=1 Tax=Irpex rosettiformis TaxID=378272 RepID=A0ACB8U2U6_9APHY|nr:hypothetical protein BDY19DRAFT_180218 [Irpex rosettiformis]